MISKCKNLSYINERPVFDDERRLAEAWSKGSYEAEKAERKVIKEEVKSENLKNREKLNGMIEESVQKHQENVESTKL